jgi:subtilisin family serine protease
MLSLRRPVTRGSSLIWIALVLMGCAALERTGGPDDPGGVIPRQLRSGQVIVTLAPASPERWASIRAALARAYDLRAVGAFPLASLAVQCVVFQAADDRSAEEVATQLTADPRVETVQPNQAFDGLVEVHDDQYAALQYGAHAIRADLAHRFATGKGVRVAVVDTGVDTTHPDLLHRIVKSATFVEGGERTFADDSHGTAVAGVIAADADNHIGIFGIAPEAEIIVAKACWHRSAAALEAVCSSWTLAKAVDFAITSDARILNLSLGGPPDPLLARLIGKAIEQGVTVIAAVMERGSQTPGFPASLEPVIAVLASDSRGSVHIPAGLTRSGLLAAPGIEVLTTAPRGAYDFRSGSSLAAAHVSGIAALLLERDPRLTAAKIRALLVDTAQPLPEAAGVRPAVGLVDACAAVAKLVGAPSCF